MPDRDLAVGPLQQRDLGQVLTIRSGSMPAASARSAPYQRKSSWPGAWASESIENRQPRSRASSRSLVGGSRRSGLELISTAVSLSTQAVKTAFASNWDCLRVPRAPITIRPVQWPSTFTRGFWTAATIRLVMSGASMASLECTLATRRSSWSSISSVWSRLPSSRMSTSMPLSSVKPPREDAR